MKEHQNIHSEVRSQEDITKLFPHDEPVYHYTNLKAALSILENKNIRLSHISTLNDTSEGLFILEDVEKNNPTSKTDKVRKLLSENTYIGSFTKHGNLLSQWRGYGDICLEFKFNQLNTERPNLNLKSGQEMDTSGIGLSFCKYINPDHEPDSIESDQLQKNIHEFSNGEIDDLQATLLEIADLCLSRKHIGFEEEQERRIYAILYEKEPFYNQNCNAFIELLLKPSTITGIIVGPSQNQKSNLKKIKIFLNHNEAYQHVELFQSMIPFIG